MAESLSQETISKCVWNMCVELGRAAESASRMPVGLDDEERRQLRPQRLKPASRARDAELTRGAIEALARAYAPEDADREFYKPMSEVAHRYYSPISRENHRHVSGPQHHRLQLVECNNGRYTVREAKVPIGRSFADFSETPDYKRSRFFETTGFWSMRHVENNDYDQLVKKPFRESAYCQTGMRESDFSFGEPGDGSAADRGPVTEGMDQEFIPLMGGPFHMQLYQYAHWEMTAKAFYEKNHSELARAAITITSDFVLGRGVTWKIRHARARAIWEEFWDRNEMNGRIRTWSDELTWQGELLVRKTEDIAGFMTVRSVSPSIIFEIITVPHDVEQVLFYHAQWPTPTQLPFSNLRGQNIRVDYSRYIIEQFAASEIHHVKLNVASSEKWGRSDFYPTFGTLKRHRDWVNAATLKDLLQANLVWKIKIHGDDGDVDAFDSDPENAKLPAFGGTWIENDAIELTPMHQDMVPGQRTGAGATGDHLISLFATNMQMPLAYFNTSSSGAARATALSQGEPMVKRVATRQQVVRRLLEHLYDEVMKRAVAAGRIAAEDMRHEDADPEWIFPSTYEEDRGAKFRDLVTAKGMAAISHRTMATQMGQELGLPEYDYNAERRAIADEQRDPFLKLWPPSGGPASAIAGSFPTNVVPQVGQWGGQQGQSGGMPGQPLENPMDQPHNVAGRAEKISGADERRRFRLEQRERPSGMTETDKTFLATARRRGVAGKIRLPSGKGVVVSNGTQSSNGRHWKEAFAAELADTELAGTRQ